MIHYGQFYLDKLFHVYCAHFEENLSDNKSFTKKLSIIEDCSETFFSRSLSSIIFIMKNNVEAYKIDNHYTSI